MPALVEKRQLTKWVAGCGVLAQACGALLVALLVGLDASVSFAGGGLALLAGFAVAAATSLRATAPSGSGAMYAVLMGAVLKWVVVAALLVFAMMVPGSRAVWVFLGLLFAQVVLVVSAMTFKRQ